MAQSNSDRIFDELLLTRIEQGDKRAADRLAARWQPRLLRTARRLLRDDEQARIAVQEAWIGICRGWLGLRNKSRFPGWAFRILHRKCADRIRFAQKKRQFDGNEREAERLAISSGVEEKVAIERAFDRLSDDHRAAAVLFFGEGLTLREIAEATQVPLGTAKSRIFNARRQLKEILNYEGE